MDELLPQHVVDSDTAQRYLQVARSSPCACLPRLAPRRATGGALALQRHGDVNEALKAYCAEHADAEAAARFQAEEYEVPQLWPITSVFSADIDTHTHNHTHTHAHMQMQTRTCTHAHAHTLAH
jgi:hypothetical protein